MSRQPALRSVRPRESVYNVDVLFFFLMMMYLSYKIG